MTRTSVHLEWQRSNPERRFRTGVSLHSHTHYSKESLGFVERLATRVGALDAAVQHGRRKYGSAFDFRRAWWTPPLVPMAAWELERQQIETRLGLRSLVSLSDHDSIEAPLSLLATGRLPDFPISVEWTVPFHGTFFHLGIHNISPAIANAAMSAMTDYTRSPNEQDLEEILRWMEADPGTLVVFNHPMWDESEIGESLHCAAAEAFLRRNRGCIHAFEVNGLRRWSENLKVMDFARAWRAPVVSGGDRHGTEANTVLNLTQARTFAEFAEELRRDGRSDVLITNRYRASFFWRMFDNVLDAVGDHHGHGLGWYSWNDRVFYLCDDGELRSLREIWGDQTPAVIHYFTATARLLHGSWFQKSMWAAMARPEEVVL